MLNSPGGGTLHYTEEDYTHDAELLTYYLRRLTDSSPALAQCCDPWQKMESALIAKWTDVVTDLTPPQATRSTRLSFYPLSSSGEKLQFTYQCLYEIFHWRSIKLQT